MFNSVTWSLVGTACKFCSFFLSFGLEQCLPKYYNGILVLEDMFLEESSMIDYIGEWEKLTIHIAPSWKVTMYISLLMVLEILQ